jgi:hypothetical protein
MVGSTVGEVVRNKESLGEAKKKIYIKRRLEKG